MRAHVVTAALLAAVAAACCGTAACGAGADTSAASTVSNVDVTCTATSADAATLQRAIDSSPPGAAIAISGGTCLLTRSITLRGDRTYTGAGTTGTVLRQDARMPYVLASEAYLGNSATTGDPLAVRDLTVACDGSGTTDGIIILAWQTDIEHVDVSHCGGSGVVDTATTASGRAITNTSVNSRFDDNFISGSGRYGFEVSDSGHAVSDGYLDNNQISASGQDAIRLQTAAGWDVSGNHLYGDRADGINASGLYGTTISGNYIEDFGASQHTGTWYGIVGTVQAGPGSTIFGNKVSGRAGQAPGAGHVYLAITQARGGTGYLSVTGNVIVGVGPGDVGLSFSGGPDRLVVASSGNQVARVGISRRSSGSVTVTGGI